MRTSVVAFVFFAVLSTALPASGAEQLGKVTFPTSCDPKVQAEFERGVAMLHSFWFSATEKTFRDVLVQDPTCTIANWGIAAILMSNPLVGQGASPKGAAAAQAAIDQGRRVSPKTQRERDYIEAVAAYYQDFSTRSERSRQESRAKAFEELAARYPNDDEARIFSALYIACTIAGGSNLCGVLEGRRNSGKNVRQVPRSSGCSALPDPQLRRAAPRQTRPARRATLCEHRAGGAACAAYAFAHLYPPWRLGRLGRDQSPCDRGGEKGG